MIFNKQKYHEANKLNNIQYFEYPIANGSNMVKSCFAIENGVAISLPKAPYCGLELSNASSLELREIILSIKKKLYSLGCKRILIKQAPALLSYTAEVLHKELSQQATSIQHEINHYINLENFESRIHIMQKRKIKKCINESLSFNVEPTDHSHEVYNFITKCRSQQDLIPNITKEHFIRLLAQLPENYQMYTIRDSNNTILACTVTLKVTKHAVYNYLPAFDRAYKTLSPLTYLQYMLSHRLAKNGFTTLDLGISSIDGAPQESLIDFKEKMGGIRQNRYTYQIENQN